MAGSDVEPLVANTADIGRCPHMVMTVNHPDEGYDFIEINPAEAVFGGCGIKEEGLAMGGTGFMFLTSDAGAGGVLAPFLRRATLQSCSTVKEAVAFLNGHKLA